MSTARRPGRALPEPGAALRHLSTVTGDAAPMHGEPERLTPRTSPAPSRELLALRLACALFTHDATSAAARLMGLPPDPGPPQSPPRDSSPYARALGIGARRVASPG